MSELINLIISAFGILTNNSWLGMPLLVWILIPCLFGIITHFLKGKKE